MERGALKSGVATVFESSAIVRGVRAIGSAFAAASRGSAAAGPLGAARRWWLALSLRECHRCVGIGLIVAATVHVVLRLASRPADWLWLIVPGIAIAQGMLLLVVSRRADA